MRLVGEPLGQVLVILAILWARPRGLRGAELPRKKGLALLKKWLTPAQLAQYPYFEVTGGRSGKHYRIRPTRQMNVDELDQHGARTVSYCFGPEGELPIGDVMLAQKIALENDEQAALAVSQPGQPISIAAPIWMSAAEPM